MQPGIGRPDFYQNREVVKSYHLRYESGIAKWKNERKKAILSGWMRRAQPARMLDVACGPARLYDIYRDYHPVSCDLSFEMLEEFSAGHPEAELVRADAAALPFASRSFDLVVAIRFLAHLRGEYRRRVLDELVRVSRRYVILDGRHRYNLRFFSRWLRRRLRLSHADKLRHTYGQFRAELSAAGLHVREFRSVGWGLSARFVMLCEISTSGR